MVITASKSFSRKNFFKKTRPNVLSDGVLNDCITNVFNDFSSYVIVSTNSVPIVLKNYERNF